MKIEEFIETGAKIAVTVTPKDLETFGNYLILQLKKDLEMTVEALHKEEFLCAENVCKIIQVDRSTLWRWAKRGYLVPVKFGNKVRYKKSDIINLMEGNSYE